MSTASIDQSEHSDREIINAAQTFWKLLPEGASIRRAPFFDLCNLAEYSCDSKIDQDLKPCPTCGGNFQHIVFTNYPEERRLVCNFNSGGCGTATATGDSNAKAIVKWNRRPDGS